MVVTLVILCEHSLKLHHILYSATYPFITQYIVFEIYPYFIYKSAFILNAIE